MFLFIISSICHAYEYHGKWEKPPEVIICETSGVNKVDVEIAVERWKDFGHNVKKIKSKKKCPETIPENTIVFMPDMGEVPSISHAVTDIFFNRYYLKSAVVYISYQSLENIDVIEHELGHAFGIKHVDEPEDIMYPVIYD